MDSNATSNNITTITTAITSPPPLTADAIAVPISNSDGATSDADLSDEDGTGIDNQNGNSQKQRGSNWTEEEDLKLVNAWCSISTDPAKGAEHKEQGLWENILDAFGATGNPNSRDWKALKNRWGIISKTCSVFSADLGLAQDKKGSGETDEDVVNILYLY